MKHGTDHRSELTRVKRIEGQVRGIGKMIEEQKYCVDILTQVKAARSALKSLELVILEEHLKHCVTDATKMSDRKEKLDEIITLLRSSARS